MEVHITPFICSLCYCSAEQMSCSSMRFSPFPFPLPLPFSHYSSAWVTDWCAVTMVRQFAAAKNQ